MLHLLGQHARILPRLVVDGPAGEGRAGLNDGLLKEVCREEEKGLVDGGSFMVVP